MELIIFTSVPDSVSVLQKLLNGENKSRVSKIIIVDWQEFEYTRLFGNESLFDEINTFCCENDIALEVITGSTVQQPPIHDVNDVRYKNLKVIKFPYYGMILGAHSILDNQLFSHVLSSDLFQDYVESCNKDLEFPFICLNSKPHDHRCIQMDMLAKHDLLENNAVTWNSWYGYEGRILKESFRYKWKYWDPKLIVLDDMPPGAVGWHGIFPKQYVHSYAQLVTESSYNQLYISEKCIAALIMNKPFLVSGARGFHKMLQDNGFELYDEIFDYEFDHVLDMEMRYDMIAQNFANIQTLPLSKCKELTKEKTKRNKKHLESFINDLGTWPSEIKDFLDANQNLDVSLNFSYYKEIKKNKIKFIRD